MKTGILGGGLAGITLARFLKGDCEILERDSVPGGLCRSFSKDGFWYDLGGHIIFSKNDETLKFMINSLGDNVKKLYRNNKIFFENGFIKYPFENGLGQLPEKDRNYCLQNYINNPYPEPRNNFREWIYYTFGKGIAELYLVPYNTKIWKRRPEELGLEGFAWVKRIPRPPMEDVLKSARGEDTEGYKHQLYFYYPKTGGIQSLVENLSAPVKDRITTSFEVKSIKKENGHWIVSDGKNLKHFDRLVSTIPIPDLVAMLEDVPIGVKKAAAGLQYNSLIVVMIGLSKSVNTDKFAVYYPQENLVFHRVCFFKYMGENYSPPGKSSAVAEITVKPGDRLYKEHDKKIAEIVIRDMKKAGIIADAEVVTLEIRRMKYGYVVYDLDYTKNIGAVIDYLGSKGIYPLGRFGEFKYLNMDMTIKNAKDLAEKLNSG